MNNVLTVLFQVESEGYQAFTQVQQQLEKKLYFIPQMALVKYHAGRLEMLNTYVSPAVEDGKAFSGGLFGSLLGIIGGPIGMLLGGTTGAVVGMASGQAANQEAASLLENVCSKLDEGTVAMVALVEEESEVVLDQLFSSFNAVVLRRPVEFVAEEVAEAKRMEEEMQRQLRAKLRAEKKAELADKLQQTKDKILSDFDKFKARFCKKE